MDEPSEEISPFDVGHAVGVFEGSETLGYLEVIFDSRLYPVSIRDTLSVLLTYAVIGSVT